MRRPTEKNIDCQPVAKLVGPRYYILDRDPGPHGWGTFEGGMCQPILTYLHSTRECIEHCSPAAACGG